MGDNARTDELPHPEGEIYDPHNYRELVRLHQSNSRIATWVGLASFAGLFTSCASGMREGSTYVSGLSGAVFTVIFVGNILHANFKSFRYEKLLRAHQRIVAEAKSKMTNNVSINVGAGATWIGDVTVGNNINIAKGAAARASNAGMANALQELISTTAQLLSLLPDEATKRNASDALRKVAEEASAPQPNRKQVQLSAKGLTEAAKAVAEMAGPISVAVKAVLALL